MLFFKKVLFHNASLIFMFSYVLKEDNFFSQWVMCGSVHREFWFWLSSFFNSFIVVVVQSPSCVWLFATPRIATRQASLSSTIPQSLTSSCSLHQWCHPAISSSDALFSFCPQSFPASGTFPKNRLFASDDQNTGSSASVFPVNIQSWSPLRLTGLISLLSKGLSGRSLLQHHSSKASILWCSAFFTVQHSQPYATTGKTIALTIRAFVGRAMSLLFKTLSRFVPVWNNW